MNDARQEPLPTPPAALLVCRGASCSERAGQAWSTGLDGRVQGLTGCQGRCATGPNAVRVDSQELLTADDLRVLAADGSACFRAGVGVLGAGGGQAA